MNDAQNDASDEDLSVSTAAIVVPVVSEAAVEVRNSARELLDAFLRGRNPNTLRAYRKDLENFASFSDAGTVEEASRRLLSSTPGDANALVLRYRNTMLERKLAATTINRRLASLRALVKLARMLGMVPWSIEIEGFDTDPYRDTRGPGEAAVAAMLERARTRGDAKGIRDAAILRLLHDRAFRRGELASLDRAHYSPVRGLSLMGKGRRARVWVSLPKEARAALEAWIELRGNYPGPLFIALDAKNSGHRLTGSSIYAIVRRLGDEVGVRARPHGLRHTAITTALDKTNGNVREVQKFSRHRNVQTLLIYDDARTDVGGEVAQQISLREDPVAIDTRLAKATNVRIVRGPRGGIRFVQYEIEEDREHVSISTQIPSFKKDALATLAFFREHGIPISDPDAAVQKILGCGRGHVHADLKAEGSYCLRDECGNERGTFKPERRIEWRTT